MAKAHPGRLGVGLVGSGFMGKAHAFAFHVAPQIFDLPLRPELAVLADVNQAQADEAARRLGFAKAVGDWRVLVNDPAVDVVAITAPNTLHKPIALAALKAGKLVYCEKPLAATLADAKEMAEAARASGRVTLAGFNYLQEPDHRARARDRRLRRDRRTGRLPRHPRRGLHGRSRRAAQLSHRSGRRRRADGSRQPHRLACPASRWADRGGLGRHQHAPHDPPSADGPRR